MTTPASNHLHKQFGNDRQGRTFSDVQRDDPLAFAAMLDFFADPDRQRRMIESEVHHLRPALAGVVRELEEQPKIAPFLSERDGHTTIRFRQAVGVVVRMVMENHGWITTHKKGSLGTRAKVPRGTTTPGAYQNNGGLSRWFVRAERYRQQDHESTR